MIKLHIGRIPDDEITYDYDVNIADDGEVTVHSKAVYVYKHAWRTEPDSNITITAQRVFKVKDDVSARVYQEFSTPEEYKKLMEFPNNQWDLFHKYRDATVESLNDARRQMIVEALRPVIQYEAGYIE